MASEPFNELMPPPEVVENGGQEFVRVILSNGGLSIAMQRAFAEPETWGLVLASLAHQAAEIFAADEDERASDILERICLSFDQHMAANEDASAHPAREN
jgi:hypothetical protein